MITSIYSMCTAWHLLVSSSPNEKWRHPNTLYGNVFLKCCLYQNLTRRGCKRSPCIYVLQTVTHTHTRANDAIDTHLCQELEIVWIRIIFTYLSTKLSIVKLSFSYTQRYGSFYISKIISYFNKPSNLNYITSVFISW